jgi:hypothetical protein
MVIRRAPSRSSENGGIGRPALRGAPDTDRQNRQLFKVRRGKTSGTQVQRQTPKRENMPALWLSKSQQQRDLL